MKKAENEKSNRFGTDRESVSPAESTLQESVCEVHSGADPAKESSQIRMKKAENEKSNRFGTDRESVSPAESTLQESVCEVHSGADPAKESSQIRWHTLHA